MDQSSQVLLDLIKCSLWEAKLPEYTETVDWRAVFNESKLQSVSGIAYSSLPDNVPVEIQSEWKNYAYRNCAIYLRIMAVQDDLLSIIGKNNIPIVILKGSAAATYYPSPSKRSMGDIV